MRARAAGYRPILCPDARLIHEIGQSSTPAGKMLLLYRGKATLLRTHWRGPARVLGLTLLLTGVAVRAALAKLVRAVARRPLSADRWLTVWRQRREWVAGYSAFTS